MATRIKLIDLEREHILNTLRQCRGNRTHTARSLKAFPCGAYVSSWLATPKWALTFRHQRHLSWRWSKQSPEIAQGGGALNGPSGGQISTIMFAASSAYRCVFFMMRSSAARCPKR